MSWQYWLLIPTTLFHLVISLRERKIPPPGKLIDLGGYKVHLWVKGTGKTTVILDHSLGGIEGYFLIEEIAQLTRVCIYDRPGYGWSDPSPKPHLITYQLLVLNLELFSTPLFLPFYCLSKL